MRILSAAWSEHGAPPEAVIEAFAEAALTVGVLDALLDEPHLREKAVAALRGTAAGAPAGLKP